jgi:DNA-directed RNA polymerase subunit RPC12/RpoP
VEERVSATEGQVAYRCAECDRIVVWANPGSRVLIVHDEAEQCHGVAVDDEIVEGEEPDVWIGYAEPTR